MSLKAWARYRSPADLTMDLVIAIALFLISIPLFLRLEFHQPARSPSQIVSLRRAIAAQESDEQCFIQNASGSGATGLGQVMPENIPVWSKEAIGRSLTIEEFLNDCPLQIQIIDFKLSQYWQAESQNTDEHLIVRRIASRWYSGNPDLYDSTAPQYWNGNRYPSIREYTLSILSRYERDLASFP